MQKKVISAAILVIYCLFFTFSSFAQEEEKTFFDPDIDFNAKSVYMVNLDTGTVIISKNANEKVYPASVTKVMTAVLVLENIKNLEEEITAVQSDFEGMHPQGSTAGIKAGETMTVLQLLHCILVQSANEACNVLARHTAGSIDAFVAMMNEKAKELGAVNTHFMNTHGLHDDEHYTTASDVAKIEMAALQYPLFKEIVAKPRYYIPATNKSPERTLATTNYLIDKVRGGSKYYYQYAKGIKTGYTNEAGTCFTSIATKNGLTYLSIMLGGTRNEKNENVPMLQTKQLFQWAFDNISYKKVLETKEQIAEVKLNLAWKKDYTIIFPKEPVNALLPNQVTPGMIEKEVEQKDAVDAPVKQGDVLGKIVLKLDGIEIGSTDLVAGENIERSAPLYYLQVAENFVTSVWFIIIAGIVITLFLFYLIVCFLYNRKKKRRTHKKKKSKYKMRF